MSATWIVPGRTHRRDSLLLLMFVISLLLHGSTLYGIHRWGPCICQFGKVVCPKVCYETDTRIDLELKPPPPAPKPPKTPPKPQVIAPVEPAKPLAAPKRGRVVLPDEAFMPNPEPPKEMTARLPSLPEEVVVRESEAKASLLATPEIFGRASELTPGPPGEFGLGGTGKATGAGPFGTAEEGSGTAQTAAPLPPPPPPPAKPKGPSRPPRVLNWTDPLYPQQARQQGVEGVVILHMRIGTEGVPRDIRVSKSSGHTALDEAAIAHVRRARFAPALKDGDPVSMSITFKVKFRLVNT